MNLAAVAVSPTFEFPPGVQFCVALRTVRSYRRTVLVVAKGKSGEAGRQNAAIGGRFD